MAKNLQDSFSRALDAAKQRFINRATEEDIRAVESLLQRAKEGTERSQRENFVAIMREILDSRLLDIYSSKTSAKLTLTLKNGQIYLQGEGTSRTLSEVDFEVRHRERLQFATRPSRGKAQKPVDHTPT